MDILIVMDAFECDQVLLSALGTQHHKPEILEQVSAVLSMGSQEGDYTCSSLFPESVGLWRAAGEINK